MIDTDALAQFLAAVREYQKAYPAQRLGQVMYNVSREMPTPICEIARDITGTEYDPFYNDKLIPAFLERLLQRGEEEWWTVYGPEIKGPYPTCSAAEAALGIERGQDYDSAGIAGSLYRYGAAFVGTARGLDFYRVSSEPLRKGSNRQTSTGA